MLAEPFPEIVALHQLQCSSSSGSGGTPPHFSARIALNVTFCMFTIFWRVPETCLRRPMTDFCTRLNWLPLSYGQTTHSCPSCGGGSCKEGLHGHIAAFYIFIYRAPIASQELVWLLFGNM